jgi:hypothetical protein
MEWRPRSTRRLATRRSPQALVTVDRCGQQARRAPGCASECRDSRVYMSWCLRPVMTWHVPAIESEISGSRSPPRRRGVILPRSPRQAWHLRVFRQAKRRHGLLPARPDQRKQGSLRLHPPSSLGAAIDERALRTRRVRALSLPSGPCAMTCLLRIVSPQAAGRRNKAGVQSQSKTTHRQVPTDNPLHEARGETRHFAVCGRPPPTSLPPWRGTRGIRPMPPVGSGTCSDFTSSRPRIIGGVVCRSTRAHYYSCCHMQKSNMWRASFTAAVSSGEQVAAAVQFECSMGSEVLHVSTCMYMYTAE